MSLASAALQGFEGAPLPDVLRRAAVGYLVGSAARRMAGRPADEDAFAREMGERRIAEHVEAANGQHYELPARFFQHVLGKNLKYSSCLYRAGDTLDEAEDRALAQTCQHADLHDGQSILELGCGWGSASLWMARAYPRSRIVAVSNAPSQRAYITAQAAERGLRNLHVITSDMNQFEAPGAFDRIVSVEMFEHMANWRDLLGRAVSWLAPNGRLFIHVFAHRTSPYRFNVDDPTDWIAQHFFTGGLMPSHGLIRRFDDIVTVEAEWRWSGDHYRRTAEDWLANFDRNFPKIWPTLVEVYGPDARLWARRWRLFFLATAGLFGHGGGADWGVSHYRLAARGGAR